MSNERFTAYLSPRERAGIREVAEATHSSENYVVRTAIRRFLGLDRSSQVSQLSRVTNENGEGE